MVKHDLSFSDVDDNLIRMMIIFFEESSKVYCNQIFNTEKFVC
jgi:hypothetical protein